MTRLPWFPMFVDDWLELTVDMTIDQEHALLRLLLWQWKQGALPVDPELLRKRTKLGARAFGLAWPGVAHLFPQLDTDPTRCAFPGLEALRQDRTRASEAQRDKAAKRWESQKPGDAPAQPRQCDPDPESSSGSSPDHISPPPSLSTSGAGQVTRAVVQVAWEAARIGFPGGSHYLDQLAEALEYERQAAADPDALAFASAWCKAYRQLVEANRAKGWHNYRATAENMVRDLSVVGQLARGTIGQDDIAKREAPRGRGMPRVKRGLLNRP